MLMFILGTLCGFIILIILAIFLRLSSSGATREEGIIISKLDEILQKINAPLA